MWSVICSVCLATKPVGEPDAGNQHVRFTMRGTEPGTLPDHWRGAASSHQQGRAVLLVLGPCIESFVRRFNEIDEYSFAASGVEHLCAARICEWSALHETRDERARSHT